MLRVLEARGWEPPDWIIVPGGNLGNCSAFGKAFAELKNWIDHKSSSAGDYQCAGANTLHVLVNEKKLKWNKGTFDQSMVQKYYAALDESNYYPHTVCQRNRDFPASESAQGAAGAGGNGRRGARGER